ncbi:hypothetical protein A2U01_0090646 [Trifolium medium]|uniref:Uncharacterized protein n=1 Tax=Trifolium medium TaxID=97028 RepID=A0A392U9B3_9FABA|nr:hypothetical protein [Trifolium medium]
MASRVASVFGCFREAVKCAVNWRQSSLHESMDSVGRFLYQDMAPFLKVVGNNLHLIDP